jgi:uncharacterized membrane-anchored protein
MKKTALAVATVLVIFVINYNIATKEKVLKNGTTMLLRLAPVDPRSLIQGDYMILRYAISNDIPNDKLENKGCIVVKLDEQKVASFVMLYNGSSLNKNEHLLFYRNRGRLRIGAESFFFQEGDAEVYSKARYGELKVDQSGASVLIGLRGDNFSRLEKDNEKNFVTDGWVSPDIYRVTAIGVPREGLKSKMQRRRTAHEAAKIMAEKRIIEKFVGARLEEAVGMADYASTGKLVLREFGSLVKDGIIVKSTFDEDDNCEIIYQVERNNLRNKVEIGKVITN